MSSTTESTLAAVDPATGRQFRALPASTAEDVRLTVSRAQEALASNPGWGVPQQRAAVLERIADGMTARRAELAELECLDTGKPLSQALADVDASARYFRFYAGAADKVFGTQIPLGPGFVDYTVREPWGVCAQIIPWNYPLQVAARCAAPALAAGNAVVVKPSEEASVTPLELVDIAREAGLPEGMLSVVVGRGDVGAVLVDDPGVAHVTFVGSPQVGSVVGQAAARRLIPVDLELGGKSPNIVFADADLDRAVPAIVKALVQNAGQSCSAGSRLIVAQQVADELLERIAAALGALSIGPGMEDHDVGPLISERQFERASGMVSRARETARVVVGGERPAGLEDGPYLQPTLVADVPADSELWNEEVFGPVLAAATFDTDDEAIALANGSAFGLVTGVWTKDVSRALGAAGRLQVGQVFVNGYGVAGGVELPFGGYKRSGYGRGKGLVALDTYTQIKNVCVAL